MYFIFIAIRQLSWRKILKDTFSLCSLRFLPIEGDLKIMMMLVYCEHLQKDISILDQMEDLLLV